MDAKEIVLALMELAVDPYEKYDYEDDWDEEVEILTDDLEDIRGTQLFELLSAVAEMNG